MSKYGITKRYSIPKLILAPIPASPLLTLFSKVALHIAHCANVCTLPTNRNNNVASIFNALFT